MNQVEAEKYLGKHGLEIDYIDSHIAFRMDKIVAINKNLFKFDQKWVKDILNHEVRHTGKLTKKDILMDLFEGDILKTLKFCFRYPKAFKQFNPFYIYKGVITIDAVNLLFYTMILIFVIIYGVILF